MVSADRSGSLGRLAAQTGLVNRVSLGWHRYPIVIRLALPPAAAVFVLIERSATSHSSG